MLVLQNFLKIGVITLVLLMIPLLGMFVSNSVQWSFFDFLVAGLLIFCTGILIDYIYRTVSHKNRLWWIVGILGIVFIIWVELAVGVFGSWFAGN